MNFKLRTMDAQRQKIVNDWLEGPYDEATKTEIRRQELEAPEELIDAFYTDLAFGTGGLRGIMGVGTNRINIYTIARASQGLANYLKKIYPNKALSIFIGYDTRHNSLHFAEISAAVFAGNNIEVFLYKEFRPVALISYGLLFKKCDAGVMITASHNPPKYNGYKVYWNHGGQVLPPHDAGIIAEVEKITSPEEVRKVNLPHPLIHLVGEEIDAAYLKTIHPLQLHPGNSSLNIVYTPLHGAGITMVPRALQSWGFSNVHIVEEQATTSGDFPTIKSPNPEERATLSMGINRLEQGGDILLATDPDVDRLAVVVMHEHKPVILNGNETACLLLEHILSSLKEKHLLPPKPSVIKTIVTTELFALIAKSYGVSCLDLLTGFKYIGGKIAEWAEEEREGAPYHRFIFGAEESYGYLYGTHARDKDAVIAAALTCELALQLKLQGKTLIDNLYAIYKKHGVHREKLLSITLEGVEGMEKMHTIMENLRKNPFSTLGEAVVEKIEDYENHTRLIVATKHKEPLLLPKSNVLRFFFSDGTTLVIRPSGTEPKIKIYVACMEKQTHDIAHAIKKCDQKADSYLALLKKMLS